MRAHGCLLVGKFGDCTVAAWTASGRTARSPAELGRRAHAARDRQPVPRAARRGRRASALVRLDGAAALDRPGGGLRGGAAVGPRGVPPPCGGGADRRRLGARGRGLAQRHGGGRRAVAGRACCTTATSSARADADPLPVLRRRTRRAREAPITPRCPRSRPPSAGCSRRSAGRGCSGASASPAGNKEIAAELVVSEETVKTHMRALFAAFDLADAEQYHKRAELARRAVAAGLVGRGTAAV